MKRKTVAHFMGVGGSGAGGVAKIAKSFGFTVSGCDAKGPSSYYKDALAGHNKNHLIGVDLLVVTPAVMYQDKNNSEYQEGIRRGIVITWQEFLGKYLLKDKEAICIAGTHGKSTTTAMVGSLLEDAGMDPTVLLGATSLSWDENFRFGKGKYFVVEADEFNDNYLNYSPDIIILNNIEFDHPDFFKNEKEVMQSFEKFVLRLKGKKILIANTDDPGVNRLLEKIMGKDINIVGYPNKESSFSLNLNVMGEHNRQNALGVVELGKVLGIEDGVIINSLNKFEGIERRSQVLGQSKRGYIVIDDYAHHPTAIKKTLEAIKQKYQDKKIWVVIEPHGYKRTKALLDNYLGVFKDAHKVIIGPIFMARDVKIENITPDAVAKASGFNNAVGVESYEEIEKIIKEAQSDDIVVVMGAGKSNIWAQKLLRI